MHKETVSAKRYQKQVEHAERMNQDSKEKAAVLRRATCLLLTDQPMEALAFIREEIPGLVAHLEAENQRFLVSPASAGEDEMKTATSAAPN